MVRVLPLCSLLQWSTNIFHGEQETQIPGHLVAHFLLERLVEFLALLSPYQDLHELLSVRYHLNKHLNIVYFNKLTNQILITMEDFII